MTKKTVSVNGKPYILQEHEFNMTLLRWLRDIADLTGTKCGCSVGHCGSCMVLINGEAKKSCLIKMGKLDNDEVVTIEGLDRDGKLHPVQQSFIECGVVQCGFCTPSMIIASVGLLNKKPNPSREDIDKALGPVFCRCGTYPRVIDAIERAVEIMKGVQSDKNEEIVSVNPIGQSILMPDMVEKITGKLKFVDDYNFPNSLYGKLIFSEFPHAKIIRIDTQEASQQEGVKLVLTHENVPEYHFGVIEKDQILLAKDIVRYIGEPVAAVFADTLEQAEAAAKKVKVDYEKLEAVLSPERALEPDAPLIQVRGNITKEVKLNKGDFNEALNNADVLIEGKYYAPRIEHSWIETESAIALVNDQGGVAVYALTQSPFRIQNFLAAMLGFEEKNVNVIQVPCGGSFGGKGEFVFPALAAIAAVKTGRPAKISLSRSESFRFHPKRHPYQMHYNLAAKKDGQLMGVDINLLSDGGAYASFSPRVMPQSVSYSTGPYYIPNVRVNGKVVFTNNPISGAMRGYGAPQVHFAMETQMDILARKLGIDPIELRKINSLKENMEVATGQVLGKGHAYDKTLDVVAEEVKKKLIPLKEKDKNIGIGIASGWRHIGGGLGPDEDSSAFLQLQPDGRLLIKVCCAELGQETQVGLAQIVSYLLKLPYDSIDISPMETLKVPYSGAVMSSRGIVMCGGALEKASKSFLTKAIQEVVKLSGVSKDDIGFKKGVFTNLVKGESLLTIKELAEYLSNKKMVLEATEWFKLPKTYYMMEDGNRNRVLSVDEYKTHHTNSYITTAVAVRADTEKKEIKVLHVVNAVDAGTIINPDAAKRQIEGGVIMGIGAALSEEFVVEDGWNKTDSFRKYKIPTIADSPLIDVIFVDNYDAVGPLGAKGIGEIGILAITPAINNAIFDLTGQRIFNLPILKYFK